MEFLNIHCETGPDLSPFPILFIHGNLGSNSWWKPSEAFWPAHAPSNFPRFPLYYLEIPGCGSSQIPTAPEELEIPRIAQQMFVAIEKLPHKKFHIVGHSTGALIAAHLLAQHPDFFHKALFVDPVGALGIRSKPGISETYQIMQTSREFTGSIIQAIVYRNKPPAPSLEILIDDAFRAVKNIQDWLVQAMIGKDFSAVFRAVHHETLVLHGEWDELLPRSDSEELAQIMPRAKFQLVPDSCHCVNVENP